MTIKLKKLKKILRNKIAQTKYDFMVANKSKELKNKIYNLAIKKKNIFSSTSGLKGYQVGKKKFSATREGYIKADKELSKLGIGGKLKYIY